MTALLRTRPLLVHAACSGEVEGGPIRYRCLDCRRGLPAADTITASHAAGAAQRVAPAHKPPRTHAGATHP
jgi:hypothetical protein